MTPTQIWHIAIVMLIGLNLSGCGSARVAPLADGARQPPESIGVEVRAILTGRQQLTVNGNKHVVVSPGQFEVIQRSLYEDQYEEAGHPITVVAVVLTNNSTHPALISQQHMQWHFRQSLTFRAVSGDNWIITRLRTLYYVNEPEEDNTDHLWMLLPNERTRVDLFIENSRLYNTTTREWCDDLSFELEYRVEDGASLQAALLRAGEGVEVVELPLIGAGTCAVSSTPVDN